MVLFGGANESDAAIALMIIRLSSPARYGSGRKTSTNKTGLFRGFDSS